VTKVEERLQKILAQAGLTSRRGAEKMISEGRVSVNNKVVKTLGTKADIEKDEIRLDGSLICPLEEKIYLAVNKPRGYVTTLRDPQQRPVVSDLLPVDIDRVFPVGRLDYDSQGLLLLTNDGDFAQRVLHPSFRIPKSYLVKIRGRLSSSEFQTLLKGVELADGKFRPDDLRVTKVNEKSTWLSLTLVSGKNRIIRRAFAALGHDVAELVRIRIGGLELEDLRSGEYCFLTKKEAARIFSATKTR